MKVNIYIANNDKQPGRKDRWIGYLIQAEGYGGKGELIDVRPVEATAYRAIIMTIVAALDRFTRPAEITLHVEKDWIIGKLIRPVVNGEKKISTLEEWQANGWRTTRGTEVKNKDDWQRLYNKLRVFEHAGAEFRFVKLNEDDKSRDKILWAIEKTMAEAD